MKDAAIDLDIYYSISRRAPSQVNVDSNASRARRAVIADAGNVESKASAVVWCSQAIYLHSYDTECVNVLDAHANAFDKSFCVLLLK